MTKRAMKAAAVILAASLAISGCGALRLNKEGELQITEKTSASMDEPGVARVINRF